MYYFIIFLNVPICVMPEGQEWVSYSADLPTVMVSPRDLRFLVSSHGLTVLTSKSDSEPK